MTKKEEKKDKSGPGTFIVSNEFSYWKNTEE